LIFGYCTQFRYICEVCQPNTSQKTLKAPTKPNTFYVDTLNNAVPTKRLFARGLTKTPYCCNFGTRVSYPKKYPNPKPKIF